MIYDKVDEMVNWMKLTRVRKLGPKRIKDLFEIFGSLNSVIYASDSELLKSRVFNEEMLQGWNKLKNVSNDNFIKVIEECQKNNIKILTLIDKEYPINLKRIPYPPLTLFLKGDVNLLNSNKVAIVGTREAQDSAKAWAFANSKFLAEKGIIIVSGGAIGIDTAAHKGALSVSNGKTIAVLGNGFFRMYPEENIHMFKEIEERGLLVSEHLPNFPGDRISLLARNRITSGLSNALILAASGRTSGSMVQTKIAFEQRRPIFCPKLSLKILPNEGMNQVIQEWGGKEIESAKDIMYIFEQEKNSKSQPTLNNF